MVPQINGVVHRCYLCDDWTSEKPMRSGVYVCRGCLDREFGRMDGLPLTFASCELTLNGMPFPATRIVVTSKGTPILEYKRK